MYSRGKRKFLSLEIIPHSRQPSASAPFKISITHHTVSKRASQVTLQSDNVNTNMDDKVGLVLEDKGGVNRYGFKQNPAFSGSRIKTYFSITPHS